jgi:DNA-directed RNA polymerase specialized sigma24 family protein
MRRSLKELRRSAVRLDKLKIVRHSFPRMPPAKRFHGLTPEDFEHLLAWLDPDAERAGVIYEKIRRRLITILAARECPVPEELADETIDRVARRVVDIQSTYVGDKAIYFLGVANNVHHEYLKRPPIPLPPEPADDVKAKEEIHLCLEQCLDSLPPDSKSLIKSYYAANKQAKIDLRKQTAGELGVSLNTLRLRALRIRAKLQTCIERCLEG